MRLIDADKEIVKLQEKIKGFQETLNYWNLRLKYDRNNMKVRYKTKKTREMIVAAEEKIKYLMDIPDTVPENAVMDGERVHRWIPCSMKMPEEKPSLFAKFKGTPEWNKHMWEMGSDTVLVTLEYEDGQRRVTTTYTHDGVWQSNLPFIKKKVVAWMPYIEPYEGGE